MTQQEIGTVASPAAVGETRDRRHAIRAFGYAVPIGTLGGLIGLGSAELRLPAGLSW